MRNLAALPKAHLHLHVGMAMRLTTLNELLAERGHEPVAFSPPRAGMSLAAFAPVGQALAFALSDQQAWERFVDEMCADHAAEGAVYIEPSVPTGVYGHVFGGERGMLEALGDLFAAAGARHGVEVRMMVPVDRVLDTPERAADIARLAVDCTSVGVVSLGLHNEERGYPATRFGDAFRIARDGGLTIAPHGGELDGPGSVYACVDVLGADRIQHGIRAIEDDELIARLAAAGVCLDVCPTSNVVLGIVPSLTAHPLAALLDAGVPCSLNADDPLIFDTTLLGEYERSRSELGFDDARLAAIAATSVRASDASPDRKLAALRSIDSWLQEPDDAST